MPQKFPNHYRRIPVRELFDSASKHGHYSHPWQVYRLPAKYKEQTRRMGNCMRASGIRRSPNTQVYLRDGPSLEKPIALAHHRHQQVINELRLEEKLPSCILGDRHTLGEDQNIDWTVAMADPFAILCDHMRKLDLNPEVVVEPYPKSPTSLRVVSLSAKDSDEDWISSMFANAELLQDLTATCDIALQNQGKLLVIEPKTFYITEDNTLSSLSAQFGSLRCLAMDCNWDISHSLPGKKALTTKPEGLSTKRFMDGPEDALEDVPGNTAESSSEE